MEAVFEVLWNLAKSLGAMFITCLFMALATGAPDPREFDSDHSESNVVPGAVAEKSDLVANIIWVLLTLPLLYWIWF